jgi:hypothetical protein
MTLGAEQAKPGVLPFTEGAKRALEGAMAEATGVVVAAV